MNSPRKRINSNGSTLGTIEILFETNCINLKTTGELMKKWPKEDLAYLAKNVSSNLLYIYMRDKTPDEMSQILKKMRDESAVKFITDITLLIDDEQQLIEEMKSAIQDAPKRLRTFLKTSIEEKEQSLAESQKLLKRQKIKV
jgi:hypothetical protein